MDFQKKSFKDRIRALMDKNKQLDTELENDVPEPQKSALNDEKQSNITPVMTGELFIITEWLG